tara:strand:+ start:1897 stop:2655 length:759 start_codon:yes stop_codon:yes gene_type:complete
MGFLHDGHLSLIRRGCSENENTIVSIFINPTQFGQGEDLAQYPKAIESDLEALRREGVDVVFLPSTQEMYPSGFDTLVVPGDLAIRLEGRSRPNHLTGVATVVCKLFSIFQPDRAYFGQKDFQQYLVIDRISRDLNLGVEVVLGETIRSSDGLALSSRNSYLSDTERLAAGILYQALTKAHYLYRNGARNCKDLKDAMMSIINSEHVVSLDYLSIGNVETLDELEVIETTAIITIAAWVGSARLIDNIYLSE